MNSRRIKEPEDYEMEDFLADRGFIHWALGTGEADPAFWEQWLALNPEKEGIVKEARDILLSLRIRENRLSAADLDRERQRIMGRISRPVKAIGRERAGLRAVAGLFLQKWAAIAAVFLGIIVISMVLINRTNKQAQMRPYFSSGNAPASKDLIAEITNNSGQPKDFFLEDSSTVKLYPGSAIRYSRHFRSGESRDIYLSGEACFTVVKNPGAPFRVFSHELVTKVLGTSFMVKANRDDKEISVEVRSGKVSVYDKDNDPDAAGSSNDQVGRQLSGVVLTPNQELVYNRLDRNFRKVLVEHPLLVNPEAIKNAFQYEDAYVADVLEDLRKAFDIDIVYDRETLKKCKITADLSNESVYIKLELICKALDTRYSVIDGQVIIQPSRCQ